MPAPFSILACGVVSEIANAALSGQGLPAFRPALAPAVSPETGLEALPAAYAIPVGHQLERAARSVIQHSVTVALLLILEVPDGDIPEGRAEEWLGLLQYAVEAVLSAGSSDGVKFLSAEVVEAADSELLAQSGVFRAQANVSCVSYQRQ